MRSIQCPYCRFNIELAGVKPGRFHPACPGCHVRFLLIVSDDPGEEPEALVMPPDEMRTHPTLATAASANKARAARGGSMAGMTVTAATAPPATLPVSGAPPRQTTTTAPTAITPGLSSSQVQTMVAEQKPAAKAPLVTSFGTRLGGYQLLLKLGQGGMGAVYLARQTSLDRNVALKVLAPRLAINPQFVSRFTREAFAAAQLTHHNVVQIHDIGVERRDGTDTNYFAMEYVEGRTLAGVVKETGQLDPEAAVGYVLQAARGLKFAHDHGLIHRDIKPDNLLLNDEGIVKVADLGLVKRLGTAESNSSGNGHEAAHGNGKSVAQTQPSVAMGTPAYMPPEQARDASGVDARADIYSLGCTLYDLLTGRPPFVGETVEELLTQHANRAVTPPDRLARHVPTELSAIVMRMLAKQPEQRYTTMDELIAALEGWLGIESGKPFSPKQEHVRTLEFAVERYSGSKWNTIRTAAIRAFLPLLLVAIVVLALPQVHHRMISIGLVGFGLATVLFYQLFAGLGRRGVLLRKTRELVFSSTAIDWLTYLVVATLVVLVLIAFDLHWLWLGYGAAAAAVAALFYFAVDVPLARDRQTSLAQTERMLKELRLRGLDEHTIQQFVCKYSGRRWEEFFEDLFGYEAKLFARRAWGNAERTLARPQHAAWREPVIAWIDRKVHTRQERRQQELLARLEAKALRAKGFDEKEATNQGQQNAERLMEKAAAVRHTAEIRTSRAARGLEAEETDRGGAERPAPQIPKDWVHDDSTTRIGYGTGRRRGNYFRRRYGSPADVATGPLARFVLASLVLIGFGMWWSNNGGVAVARQAVEMVGSRQEATIQAAKKGMLRAIETQREWDIANPMRQPLRINHLPDWLCDAVGSWNGAVAGALLLLSIFFAGRALAVGVALAAGVALFGHRLPIAFFSQSAATPMIVAGIVWLLSVVFLRRTVDV
jgi:eukaryotic-like serine/threonine-protein kinase